MEIYSRFEKALLYWNTLRYLRPVQIIGRLKRVFYKPKIRLGIDVQKREVPGKWLSPAQREVRMVASNEFRFLNETHIVHSVADWNNAQWSKLWLYNLHYFDDLTATDAILRRDWHQVLIERWIEENPPGTGNGWEPYPTSLRIVNWIKWGLAGNELENYWLKSLVIQAGWLEQNLETHLLGNHLFANAKALIFAGFFLQGGAADRWYETGVALVERELPEQVLGDGGNFELSTMYHLIFLEDLLDLVNIYRAYAQKIPDPIKDAIVSMIRWMELMCHPDGEIAFFNDAALGVTPSVAEIRSYGERLGFNVREKHFELDFVDLPCSGYSRIEMEDAVAIIDRAAIGPDYLPGHAHADTLSFELSLFEQRVVVNPGTSVYGADAQRQQERGTAAHSTVTIDQKDSSEVWGGFRVARRAQISERIHRKQGEAWVLSANHDGYCRLPGKPVHYREWLMSKRELVIRDKIMGQGVHHVASAFPLHPKISVNDSQDQSAVLNVEGHLVQILIEGDGSLELASCCYHPEFGRSIDSQQLIYNVQRSLPIEITTRIAW